MAIPITVKSIEEVPEVMREFVGESNGAFSFDDEKAFQALKEERAASKTARANLKTANESLKAYQELGKTPEEIAEAIKAAQSKEPASVDVTKSAEYLTLKKQFDELDGKYKPMFEAYQKAEAEKTERATWDAVENIIGRLPEKYDREAVREWAKDAKSYFKLDAIGDLEKVGDVSAEEFLTSKAEKLHFVKSTVPSFGGKGRVSDPNAKVAIGTATSAEDALASAAIIE